MNELGEGKVIRFLGNNEIRVVVSAEDAEDAYCVLELEVQPGGGATSLHTDNWIETFHIIEGSVDWTLERNGELVNWRAGAGETVVVPRGAKHRFVGAGETPTRLLTVGPGSFEKFFRALAAAWSGPYDREMTPRAVAPVFASFGMHLVEP